jgi:catechol 2,3-dioxygenase-like lactoylglutathione lyase family enzyme
MITGLANVTFLVKDYDEAIRWYTETLGLELRMDGSMGGDYRFVTVGVKGQDDVAVVLHKPADGYLEAHSGVHGFLFHTDDCRGEAERLRQLGVEITLEPEEQPWGVQAVFEDLYGNSHVLLQPSDLAFRRGHVEV